MSRPCPLPPRCPLQSRSTPARWQQDDALSRTQHRRFPSLGSIVEEQPSWLDDLLAEPGTSQKATTPLRRTASDPVAILDASAAFHGLGCLVSEGAKSTEPPGGSGSGLEASCVYGPNSPRRKSIETDPGSSKVTTLLENVPWKPLQFLSVDSPGGVNVIESHVNRDVHDGVDGADSDKAIRRRSGQRSRVRKLQYIAELERAVDHLQTLGAELAAQVACQFQQRAALSMENKKLKQQMIILRQEKLVKNGHHKSLKNELERLKMNFGCHRRTKSAASCFEMDSVETDQTGTSWQVLDMGKLSLGGSQFL